MRRILMVLTSHQNLPYTENTTGVWLGEFTDPYYEFIDKKHQVTLASPKGGLPPVDTNSKLFEDITASNKRFHEDPEAREKFSNTLKLSSVRASDYDGVFYPGGHGPMWDLAQDEYNAQLLLDFYRDNKAIGAVCHGPAAFILAAEKEPSLLAGRNVTGFSNTEEKLAGLYAVLPFKLEDRLKELGGIYEKSSFPYTSKVVVSGKLVTGQNPASSLKAAKEFDYSLYPSTL